MTGPVLADTSVWVEMLGRGNPRTAEMFRELPVHTHELVLGELILGFIPRGHAALQRMEKLPRVPTLPHDQVVQFVRAHKMEGLGIGWIDAHLVAAAEVADARLWTTDRAMLRAAKKVGVDCVTE